MKKIISSLCVLLSGLTLLPFTASASHMAGAQIEYVYMGTPNVYLFRLKFYRDCFGINITFPAVLCANSISTNSGKSIPLGLVSLITLPNSPCLNLPPSNCLPGLGGQGIEQYVFEAIDTLPNAATDWVFSYSDCCRNAASTTLSSNGLFVSATLDNVNHPSDNSPVFNPLPYSTICQGYPYYYDLGAIDPDGDSLNFTLVSAQENNGGCPPNPTNSSYLINPLTNVPYTPTQPMGVSVPITIDPTTGTIYVLPNLQQVAVVCVLVSSFDSNGALIGTTKSDVQIIVTNACNPINPAFPSGPNSPTYFPIGDPTGQTAGPYYCGDSKFILPFSEPVLCNSISPTDIRVLRASGFPNPVLSAIPLTCTNGRADSIEVTCFYPLTSGNNLVTIKTGLDGNTLISQCGSAMQPYHDTIAIIINDFSTWQSAIDTLGCVFNQKTISFNEQVFCNSIAADASDLQMRDAAGNNLPISSAYGYCSPAGEQSNQLLITFATTQTTTSTVYYLTVKTGNDGNTIANECGRFLNVGDTLAIFFTNNTIAFNLGTDISTCDNAPVSVLSAGLIDPSLTYQWIFNSTAINGATNATYAATNGTGSYSLTVYQTNNPLCYGLDTLQIIINASPTVIINDTIGCVGSTIVLDAGSTGLGYHYQWYLNGNGLLADTNQTISVTVAGIYTALVTNGSCFSWDDALVSYYSPAVVPQFNNQNQSVCVGSTINALSADNPGLYYQWSENGVPQPGATFQTYTPVTTTAGNTIISVEVGTGACVASGTMLLEVVDYPTVSVNDANSCEGDPYPTFDAGNIAGATYQWMDVNLALVSNSNLFTPPATLNAGTYYYNVMATVAPGCTTFDTVVFNVDPCLAAVIIVPNIFTPNGDKLNDVLTIENIELYPNNRLTILNRWGKKIYSNSYNNSGNVFTGEGLTEGMYYYTLTLGDNKSEPIRGTLIIRR